MNIHSKVYDHSLDEYIPGLSQNLDNFDNLVDPLFDFPVSWRDMIAPPVLTMSAIALRDACLLKISVQHALCDATGVFDICDLRWCFLMYSYRPLQYRTSLLYSTANGITATSDSSISYQVGGQKRLHHARVVDRS